MEAIDTTTGYVMQQGSKERHTVGLMDLPHEHRDAEALPSSLPRQERALALRQMPALAVMLRALVRQIT